MTKMKEEDDKINYSQNADLTNSILHYFLIIENYIYNISNNCWLNAENIVKWK